MYKDYDICSPCSFGLGPYWLSGPLSVTRVIKCQSTPIKGIKLTNTHQPLFPVSCSLLTVTAYVGIIMNIVYRGITIDSMTDSIVCIPDVGVVLIELTVSAKGPVSPRRVAETDIVVPEKVVVFVAELDTRANSALAV